MFLSSSHQCCRLSWNLKSTYHIVSVKAVVEDLLFVIPSHCRSIWATFMNPRKHSLLFVTLNIWMHIFLLPMGHGSRVVTLSPPTSEIGVRIPAPPQVGKLVVLCHWLLLRLRFYFLVEIKHYKMLIKLELEVYWA